MTRRIANLLIWLALTAEIDGVTYGGIWQPPLMFVGSNLFHAVASIVPWDVLVVLTLFSARNGLKNRVPAMMTSFKLMAGVFAFIWLAGVVRGGSPYQTYFQLHNLIMGLVTSFLVSATTRTLADVRKLGKVVVWACLYRAVMCILFYLLVVKDLPDTKRPACLTDHYDSALFVVGWLLMVINAFEIRTGKALMWLLFASAPIATAIVLNNRRLAWAAFAIGLAVMWGLLEKTKLKRKLTRAFILVSPLLIAYVAAGWGHSTGIFKPVGSISSMFGEHQDESSKMRDIENYNLLVTLKQNAVVGYGWGREYIEEAVAINIADIFPQYRYLPHNSLLGMVAFTGFIGLWGTWQLLAVSAFFHAKVYRVATKPVAKTAALTSLVAIIVVQLEMWGDLGLQSQMVDVVVGIIIGLSDRLVLLIKPWDPPAALAAAPASPVQRPAPGYTVVTPMRETTPQP